MNGRNDAEKDGVDRRKGGVSSVVTAWCRIVKVVQLSRAGVLLPALSLYTISGINTTEYHYHLRRLGQYIPLTKTTWTSKVSGLPSRFAWWNVLSCSGDGVAVSRVTCAIFQHQVVRRSQRQDTSQGCYPQMAISWADCPRQQMPWSYFAQPVSTQLWRIQGIQKCDQCTALIWRQPCPTLDETNPKIFVLLHNVAGLVVANC